MRSISTYLATGVIKSGMKERLGWDCISYGKGKTYKMF
jgi:hypothetical protein